MSDSVSSNVIQNSWMNLKNSSHVHMPDAERTCFWYFYTFPRFELLNIHIDSRTGFVENRRIISVMGVYWHKTAFHNWPMCENMSYHLWSRCSYSWNTLHLRGGAMLAWDYGMSLKPVGSLIWEINHAWCKCDWLYVCTETTHSKKPKTI